MSRDETLHLIAAALTRHRLLQIARQLGLSTYPEKHLEAAVEHHLGEYQDAAEAVYDALHQVEEGRRTSSFPVMHFARDHGVDYGDALVMFSHYLRTEPQFRRTPQGLPDRQEFLASKRLMDHDPNIFSELEALAQVERERREKVI